MEVVFSILEKINNKLSDKRIVATFMGNLLKRQCPKGYHQVIPTEHFKWPLWPIYLKIYSSFRHQSAKHTHFQLAYETKPGCLKWAVPLSDEETLHVACSHAVMVLEEVYFNIFSGKITMKQLCRIEEQKEQLVKLWKAASGDKDRGYLAVDTLLLQMEKHKCAYERLTNRVGQLKALLSKVTPYLIVEGKLSTCHLIFDIICLLPL